MARIRSKTRLTIAAAARMLCEHEAHHSRVHQWMGRDFEPVPPQPVDVVREVATVFVTEPPHLPAPMVAEAPRLNKLTALPRSVLILAIAVLAGMVLLQALSLVRPGDETGQAIKYRNSPAMAEMGEQHYDQVREEARHPARH